MSYIWIYKQKKIMLRKFLKGKIILVWKNIFLFIKKKSLSVTILAF